MKISQTKRLERLTDRYQNGGMDRRTFLALTAAAFASVGVFTRWTGPALAAISEVRYDGWGGTTQDAFDKFAFKPYTAKTGVNVVQGTYGEESDMIAKIKAGKPGDYQIFHSSGIEYYKLYADLGWTSELNEKNIPNLANVMTAMIEPFRKLTPKLSAVPYDYGSTGIAFNTKVISPEEVEEKGANILIDKRFAGKIGGVSDWITRVWYGALQTGQDPNNIQDIDAVWAKLREARDMTKKYWGSGAELMDLLSREEIVVTEGWSGRIASLQDQGHPIGFINPPNVYGWLEDIFVLRGSPMDECEELLNFLLDTTTSIAVAEGQNHPPSLDPTKVKLSEKITKLPAFDPTGTMKTLTFADPIYWAEHEVEWQKQWNRIAKGS